MRNTKLFLSILFFQTSILINAQQTVVPLNAEAGFEIESLVFQSDSNIHTVIKPYTLAEVKRAGIGMEATGEKFFLNKYYNNYQKKEYGFYISPLISASGQLQIQNNSIVLPEYGAGVYLESNIGKKLSLSGTFRFLGENLPDYLDTSIYNQDVIPSINRINYTKNEINYTNQLEGYLSYVPNQFFSFLLGKGRNFWGDGYRSLLVSDNTASYPYFRINTTFWNVKYVNLYSWHNDFTLGENRNKFSSSHFLSWNILPEINLGIFETVVWQGSDTLHNRGYDVSYLNPAIFYRPVEYSQGSSDNSIIGGTLKIKIKKKHIVYGQVVLDEFFLTEIRAGNKWWANKQGGQIGYKYYNAFAIENLNLQTEFNIVRPFTYSHLTSFQNYAHNNQSLAHPVGANYLESVSFIRYKRNKWYFEEEFCYLKFGADSSAVSYGGDMFKSYSSRDKEYGHTVGQGQTHDVIYNKIRASYLLFQPTNLRVYAQYVLRMDKSQNTSVVTNFFQLGVSSKLWNEYRDY